MPAETPLSADQCFQQAGRLATNWALIEVIVENTLLILIEADLRKGRFVTKNINFPRQKQGLQLLLKERMGDKFDKTSFSEIFGDLDRIRIARNEIIHGEWKNVEGTTDNPILKATQINPDTLKSIPKEYSASTIKDWADRANRAEHDLIHFLIETCGISPLRDTL